MSTNTKKLTSMNGFFMIPIVILLSACPMIVHMFLAPLSLFLFGFLASGFFILKPNEGLVGTLFGKYSGSMDDTGFHWINPFISKTKISLKIHNYNTPKLKVNDRAGNPVEIACVITYKVVNQYDATFSVEDYVQYIENQSEGVIRKVASSYNYDSENEKEHSLKRNIEEVSDDMQKHLQKSFMSAGVKVIDAKISHLAYSPEIAQVMLRKQQAEAVVNARKKIVEGAVLMVEEAISSLESKNIATFTNDDKVSLVKNLMTVLVSENDTNQVITM